MNTYIYPYYCRDVGTGILFHFPLLLNATSTLPKEIFGQTAAEDINAYAHWNVRTTLKELIHLRKDIPVGTTLKPPDAAGCVQLTTIEAMKLEFYQVYRENCASPEDLAKRIKKSPTIARRLLDLEHQSRSHHIESALSAFGRHLIIDWQIRDLKSLTYQ